MKKLKNFIKNKTNKNFFKKLSFFFQDFNCELYLVALRIASFMKPYSLKRNLITIRSEIMITMKETEKRKFPSFNESEKMELGEAPAKIAVSPIMKLDIDCFHEVFDYLSLDDLISIGHSCKRLQRIAGSFIQRNFVAKRKTCVNNNIYMCWTPRKIGIFSRFIEKISIFGGFSDPYQYLGSNRFNSIREIRLAQVELSANEVACMREILMEVEVVSTDQCRFHGEFYENFLKFCPKVKNLSVSRSSYDRDRAIIIGTGNEWLKEKYPLLEHLELTDLYEFKNNDLKILLQQNPLQSFSTDAKSLLINQHSFLSSDVKLDRLAVDFHHPKNINTDVDPSFIVNMLYNLLMELHEKGFYKSLHMYITFVDRDHCMQKLFSLNSLEMLGGFVNSIENPLKKLRELDINKGSEVNDLGTFPIKIPELERVCFSEATSDDILPFICHSIKLKMIKIDLLLDGTYLENGVLDLVSLNKEREKLNKARKIVIYVNEDVFIATKWARSEMNYKLIECRRGESFECEKLNAMHRFIKSF